MRKGFTVFISLLLFQCARQSQPAGGPKDVDPPELQSSIPNEGQKNYKGKEVTLVFDEFVKLKDPQDEIVITPSAGEKTKIVAKKNKVTITPGVKWKDNTTYSISFRGGIQDINESNPTDNLHIAFSTGNIIDSLEIVGTIREIFQEKIPQKVTIALYQSDTFDIFNDKPIFLSKADKKGRFKIQNLKPGNYFIYAFEDKNKNFKIDSKSEKFGYLSKSIKIPDQKDSLRINLIHVDTRPIKITSVRNTGSISTVRFNKTLDSLSIESKHTHTTKTFGTSQSEVIIYKTFDKNDSLKINIHGTDSTLQKIDSAVYIKYTDNKKITDKFKQSDWSISFDNETSKIKALISFNKLISKITYDSIYIQLDTASYQQIKPEDLYVDTLHNTIKLETKLNIEIKEKMLHPVLLLGKAAFISIDNDSSKTQDVKLDIPSAKDTGTLTIEVKTNERHYEVHLLDAKDKVTRILRDGKKITWAYLVPGEYKIITIVDTNNNNKWDAGNFYKKIEPEKAIIYTNTEGTTKFPIRANWEVGPLLITF